MTTTATLPTGQKVRTASKSPMVLYLDFGHGAFIEKRSASRDTLIKSRRARGRMARAFIVWTDGTGRVEEV